MYAIRSYYVSFKDAFITDEIVIHKKDIPAPAGPVDGIQFRNNLPRCFGARPAAKSYNFV